MGIHILNYAHRWNLTISPWELMTACSALDVKKAEQVCLSVLPTFFLLVESGFCSGICPSTSQLSLSTHNPGESWSGMIIPSLISRIQLLMGFSKYSLRYGSKSKVSPRVAHACVMKKGEWKSLHESEDWNSNLMIKVSLPLVIC